MRFNCSGLYEKGLVQSTLLPLSVPVRGGAGRWWDVQKGQLYGSAQRHHGYVWHQMLPGAGSAAHLRSSASGLGPRPLRRVTTRPADTQPGVPATCTLCLKLNLNSQLLRIAPQMIQHLGQLRFSQRPLACVPKSQQDSLRGSSSLPAPRGQVHFSVWSPLARQGLAVAEAPGAARCKAAVHPPRQPSAPTPSRGTETLALCKLVL